MASAFSHIIVAAAIGKCVRQKQPPRWYWALGAFLSIAPDLDVIGFRFGVRYGDLIGHRGLTHSLFFAVCLSGAISLAFPVQNNISRFRLFVFLFLATASHGALDAMTNGGLGVAFFSPFSNERYFFPFHPVEVSPLGVRDFFTAKGIEIIQSEALWIWLPSGLLYVIVNMIRRSQER
ncbi:MAG: metal-dependent hydrolase [Gammaproteobacteria bacterium]